MAKPAKRAPLTLATIGNNIETDHTTANATALKTKNTDNKVRGYNFRMHKEELAVLKQASLDHEISLRDMIAEALSDWLAKKNIALTFEPITTKQEK